MIDVFGTPALNHHTVVEGGLLAAPAAEMLRSFFAERREQYRQQRSQRSLHRDAGLDPEPIPAGESSVVDDGGPA